MPTKKLGMGAQASTQQQSRDSGMGGLGDLLGPILGGLFGGSGAGTGQASGSSGSGGTGGFGDILGQILAGQAPKTQQAPVETHDDGQWTQPPTGGGSSGSFGNARGDSSDGGLTMPTVDEDPRGHLLAVGPGRQQVRLVVVGHRPAVLLVARAVERHLGAGRLRLDAHHVAHAPAGDERGDEREDRTIRGGHERPVGYTPRADG